MKEYVALLLFIFFVVVVLPLVVVSLAPPFKGNIVMEAKHDEKKVFILRSSASFLDVSRVDSELKRDLRLPDLYIIETRNITMVELRGRWDLSAYPNVDRVELYYVKPGRMVEEKLNLTIVIYPTYEADIYENGKFLNRTPNILDKARDFGIDVRAPRDLSVDKEKREKLLKGIFGENILPAKWVIFWRLLGSTSTEKNITGGKLYTISGSFSLIESKDSPEIVWMGREVGVEKRGVLEINLTELERTKEYPYFFLSASFKGDPIVLRGNEPRLGYTTRMKDLEEILDCYYRYFLGGGNPLIRNYTNMIPGLFAQKWMLGYANPFDLSPITLDERRAYVEIHIDSVLRGVIKPEELTGRMFWSVMASWIVNYLFISALLTIAVWISRRAW